MQVQVLYFGVLKDATGTSSEQLDLPEGSTAAALLDRLRPLAPTLCDALAIAVNREYVHASTLLREGDEVALLPPVSGGTHAP